MQYFLNITNRVTSSSIIYSKLYLNSGFTYNPSYYKKDIGENT